MNTDQYPNLYQNQYFQLDNKSERSHQSNKDQKALSDVDLIQKPSQNYVNYMPNHAKPIQSNQRDYRPINPHFDQIPQNQPQLAPNAHLKGPEPISNSQQNQVVQKQSGEVIIYNQMNQTMADLKNYQSNPKLTVIVDGGNVKDSILYGQSVPCQRCGLVSNGHLSLHRGRTISAWATCLFLTTGIFCFLPCVMDSCKDTWIECARCGHKKAVVKSKLCC